MLSIFRHQPDRRDGCNRTTAEDLCAFLVEQGVPTAYLHSDVKPMHRLELLRQLRCGEVDVIVGVNLLREVGLILLWFALGDAMDAFVCGERGSVYIVSKEHSVFLVSRDRDTRGGSC